jgi:hypothetical protein
MSRSKGPAGQGTTAQGGGAVPHWRNPIDRDAQGRPLAAGQQPPHQQQPQQVNSPYHQPGQPYGYPQQGADPGYAPQHAQPQYHYPQGAPADPNYGYQQQGQFAQPQQPAYDRYAGQQPAPSYAPRPDHIRELGWRQPEPSAHAPVYADTRPPAYDPWSAGRDVRDYDLGNYQSQPAPAAGEYPGRHSLASRLAEAELPWPEDQYQPNHYEGANGLASLQYGQHGESLPVAGHDAEEHDDEEYESEPPRRSRRGLMIVAALVGAIGIGGGLAFGYKSLLGSGGKDAPPVIKADQRPVKTQPADPGGKQFAHRDSKLMGRLGENSDQTAASGDSENGVRKVSTLVVGRDGSIGAPAPEAAPRGIQVPGMTIVDGFGSRPAARPPEPQVQQGQPGTVVIQRPQIGVKPNVAAAPAPQPQVISKAAPAPEPEAPAAKQRVAAKAPVEKEAPAAVKETASAPKAASGGAAGAAGAAGGASTGAAGYVAVLSSQKSRMDALKSFADLQQKYGSLLQGKIPDVQEADLSSRGLGTVYRVMVGPPGSREAANSLCGRLKTAGYTGCWVTGY